MSRISIFGGWLGAIALLGCVPALHASEEVTLTNGYHLLCDHREQAGGRVRMFTSQGSDNFVEVDAAEIASVEFVPDPPPPPIREVKDAEPRLTQADVHRLMARPAPPTIWT